MAPLRALLLALVAIGSLRAQESSPPLIAVATDGTLLRLEAAHGAVSRLENATPGYRYRALATSPRGEVWALREGTTSGAGSSGSPRPLRVEILEFPPPLDSRPATVLEPEFQPSDLAFDEEGRLWAVSTVEDSAALALLDPFGGVALVVGELGVRDLVGLTWHEGSLLAWSESLGLLRIDPGTASATPLGPPPEPGGAEIHFLAALPGGGLRAGGTELYGVDPTSGALVLLGDLGGWTIAGADRSGPNCWYPYGSSCAGSGGVLPRLFLPGCAAAGGTLEIRLEGALGGGLGVMILALGEARIPLGNGCEFLLGSLTPPSLPLHIAGENPGEGRAIVRLALPHGLKGFCTAQAFLLDPGAPASFTASNAVSLRVPW